VHCCLAEIFFRNAMCKLADRERTVRIIGQTTKRRLTYRKPIRGRGKRLA
jgi:hypothetical protein